MTGKILIVDAQATNRIVLKVKLSAAFYKVFQAGGGQEAVTVATRVKPDLLLVSGDLPDMRTEALIAALKRGPGTPPPVVVMLPEEAAEKRIAALRAGAADVIAKPVEEGFVLARLRSILRQRHLDADFALQSDTAEALGFAEEPAAFGRPQTVAVLGGRKSDAVSLCQRLAPLGRQEMAALGQDDPKALAALGRGPDTVLVLIGAGRPDAGVSALAELQASPRTRHSRLMAVLDREVAHLAVPVLDMGAHEALILPVDDRELALRLSLQLAQKRRADAMRARLEDGLQAAVIDPLTRLYNRRYAVSFLKRMIAEAGEGGETVAVMVADLDHFKAVNDTFGHAAGDRVLAQISARMRQALPAGDMIARIGGEEFLIAVPDTSLEAASRLADRLCRIVRETAVPLPGEAGPVHVTVSIGVTLATPRPGAASRDVEALIDRADRALYDSKSGGRDTVTFCMRSAA